LRGHQQHHGDADAADVGLDPDQRSQDIAENDAEQIAPCQQCGAEDHHGAPPRSAEPAA
jgi:hypothetical protein